MDLMFEKGIYLPHYILIYYNNFIIYYLKRYYFCLKRKKSHQLSFTHNTNKIRMGEDNSERLRDAESVFWLEVRINITSH